MKVSGRNEKQNLYLHGYFIIERRNGHSMLEYEQKSKEADACHVCDMVHRTFLLHAENWKPKESSCSFNRSRPILNVIMNTASSQDPCH